MENIEQIVNELEQLARKALDEAEQAASTPKKILAFNNSLYNDGVFWGIMRAIRRLDFDKYIEIAEQTKAQREAILDNNERFYTELDK